MRQGARLRGAILPRPEALPQRPAPWQHALRQAARSPHELLSRLGLEPADVALSADAARDFPLLVPQGLIDRMRPGDAADPLLRQVLPAAAETLPVPGFITDPLAEAAARAAPGILHKYAGRALLVLTGACAVHCRYCFRRHFPYQEAGLRPAALDQALAYLAADTTLHEVILSGGDPLTLADARLAPLADRLAALPALRTLRIHTRLPVVLPERVDERLLAWLAPLRLRKVLVLHVNHAREIDAAVAQAVARLGKAGVTLLNQSVLLRGVNDSAAALADLSERLWDIGVLPYYLHLLDHVQGAAHFEVRDAEAQALMSALRARLPGYLVPRLAREEAGLPYKRVIA